jgi:DNA-binding NarL/FixJ family response regulator
VQARIVIGDGGGHQLSPRSRARLSTLTDRELVVLRYVARGLSKKEIAGLMDVTSSAVDRHCTRIMTKLDLHDRVALARFAIREGLVDA